jgi:hypothetical protein
VRHEAALAGGPRESLIAGARFVVAWVSYVTDGSTPKKERGGNWSNGTSQVFWPKFSFREIETFEEESHA